MMFTIIISGMMLLIEPCERAMVFNAKPVPMLGERPIREAQQDIRVLWKALLKIELSSLKKVEEQKAEYLTSTTKPDLAVLLFFDEQIDKHTERIAELERVIAESK